MGKKKSKESKKGGLKKWKGKDRRYRRGMEMREAKRKKVKEQRRKEESMEGGMEEKGRGKDGQ